MRLNILSIAYPLTEVGPNAVGGSEQILTILDKALVEAGHQSLVIAAEGSRVSGTLIPSPRYEGQLNDSIREWGQQAHKQIIADTLNRYPVDLVHMHSLDFHRYLPSASTPVLATLHLPVDWYPRRIFYLRRAHLYLNCVSSSQERQCPNSSLLLSNIPNGVELHRVSGKITKGKYVVSLGRICPEKGFHTALDAAKKARSEMILAGQVFPYKAHLKYFESMILPRLDQRRRFIGPLGLSRKRKLLAEARCLLVASTVAETSSLVSMEALAAGTPVVAFATGALPEIIEHGRTGYVVKDVNEMADAIHMAAKLDPEECRNAARTRFSAGTMVQRYLATYRELVSKHRQGYESEARASGSWLFEWNRPSSPSVIPMPTAPAPLVATYSGKHGTRNGGRQPMGK